MKIFVTGASGFIGSKVIAHLISAGHSIEALVRSKSSEDKVKKTGAIPVHGDLADLKLLTDVVPAVDAVIHLAFNPDFTQFAQSSVTDREAIEAIGLAMSGTTKRLIVTTGLAGITSKSRIVTENFHAPDNPAIPRVSEQAALSLSLRGIDARLIRLGQIHDVDKMGLVSRLVSIAKTKGFSAYVESGLNRWPAAHVNDTALLFKLVLEKGEKGHIYHAVAEEGVTLRDIAEKIGSFLNLPVKSIPKSVMLDHFGPLSLFVAADMPASSLITRMSLGWKPDSPSLLTTLRSIK